jgi:hypothetical protein
MPAYRCPQCPLIFESRTEVEQHAQHEHRSRVSKQADLHGELASATQPLTSERLAQLRSSKASPSVTLLIATAPAATMTVFDIARLRQIAERARRRLSAEPDSNAAAAVVEKQLSKALSSAETVATDRGMAVLVNEHHSAIITLPFSPRDRHVVDRDFATRDLEYTLYRYPCYRVLVLGHRPRILEGRAHELSEATVTTEEIQQVGSSRHNPSDADPDVLLTQRINAAGILPLVITGDHRHVDRFYHVSRYAGDIVAEVLRPKFRKGSVADLVEGELARLHSERQARSIAVLRQAEMQSQVAWGIRAAWKAVSTGNADRLWVEHDYAVPGRIVPGAQEIETTIDPAEPGVVDDLLDALLAKAASLAIPSELFDHDALNHPEPVAVRTPILTSVPSDFHTRDDVQIVEDGVLGGLHVLGC